MLFRKKQTNKKTNKTVALFSSSSVSADPEFISGGDSAYVPGVSAVDWGNGHIEQPHVNFASGGSSWGGRKSGGSSWTRAATPAKSGGGGKKKRSSEVSPPAVEAEAETAETAVEVVGEQN